MSKVAVTCVDGCSHENNRLTKVGVAEKERVRGGYVVELNYWKIKEFEELGGSIPHGEYEAKIVIKKEERRKENLIP